MISKEIYRMSKSFSFDVYIDLICFFHTATTILCITIVLVLVQCTTSQPLSASAWKNDKIDDDAVANPSWMKSLTDSEYNDMNIENDDSNELSHSIPKLLFIHSEHADINEPKSLEPVRRANFWKRANFWRKRANFWRRDSSP
jgi:hypothetical protein